MDIRATEKEAVVQDRNRHGYAATGTVSVVVEGVVGRVVPKYFRGGGRTRCIRNEMLGVERAGIRPSHGQATAERQMIELENVLLAADTVPVEIDDMIEAVDGGVDEMVVAGSTRHQVVAAPAIDRVVAALAVEPVVAGIAGDRVGEARTPDIGDARESIGPDRAVPGRRTGGKVNGDASRRVEKADSRVAIADDGVVAAETLEFVERAVVADVQRTRLAEARVAAGPVSAGRVVAVGEIRSTNRLDRPQRIGAD